MHGAEAEIRGPGAAPRTEVEGNLLMPSAAVMSTAPPTSGSCSPPRRMVLMPVSPAAGRRWPGCWSHRQALVFRHEGQQQVGAAGIQEDRWFGLTRLRAAMARACFCATCWVLRSVRSPSGGDREMAPWMRLVRALISQIAQIPPGWSPPWCAQRPPAPPPSLCGARPSRSTGSRRSSGEYLSMVFPCNGRAIIARPARSPIPLRVRAVARWCAWRRPHRSSG